MLLVVAYQVNIRCWRIPSKRVYRQPHLREPCLSDCAPVDFGRDRVLQSCDAEHGCRALIDEREVHDWNMNASLMIGGHHPYRVDEARDYHGYCPSKEVMVKA